MPESVEIPAPVRATTERASAIHWRTDAMTASAGAGSRDMGQFCHMTARGPACSPKTDWSTYAVAVGPAPKRRAARMASPAPDPSASIDITVFLIGRLIDAFPLRLGP